MEHEIAKLLSRMYRKKTLWLFLLSIVTAIVALGAMQSDFGIPGGPRATYFLCFCVSFSAYQVVSAINKSAEALLGKASCQRESDVDLSNSPSVKTVSKFCMHCGNPLIEGASFCASCGSKQETGKE